MKTTVSEYEFYDAFRKIRPDNFSAIGLHLLWQYFEDYEEDTGDEIELDVIAICCEYSEAHITEIADDYGIEIDADGLDEDEALEKIYDEVRDYLQEHTTIVGESGETFVYADF